MRFIPCLINIVYNFDNVLFFLIFISQNKYGSEIFSQSKRCNHIQS